MSVLYTMKVSSIQFKPVGVATPGDGTPITDIQEGLQITQEDPTTTTIESELTEAPLIEIDKLGKLTVTFDLAGIEPGVASALSGYTYDSDLKKFTPPTSAPNIALKFRIDFAHGFEDLIIYNGRVTCKIDGTDLKTTPLKMNVKITALSYSPMPYEFGVGGVIRTSW